ncbi:MAG: hypothetical protein JXM72_05410 [Deltaproteobacteria bacterium]|nr:hypothetical protein [Deltaproteobacteria bacterium]
MADQGGKKAELDKDGIYLEKDKAELDKDGISLSDAIEAGDVRQDGAQQSDTEKTTQRTTRSYKTLIIASITGVFIIVSSGILWSVLHKEAAKPGSSPYAAMPVVETVYTPEGDIILDPFMILYDTKNSTESGILLAQLSLQIIPETAANIESNIFAVRSLILDRLSTNAQIYSKNELAEILREDLQDFKVKDVAFIQYELR